MDVRQILFFVLVAVAIIVMALILSSTLRHRQGQQAGQEGGASEPVPGQQPFHQNPVIDLLWNIAPIAILVALAWPAVRIVLAG